MNEQSYQDAVDFNVHLRETMSTEIRKAASEARFDDADKLVETYIKESETISKFISWCQSKSEQTSEQTQGDRNA